MTNAVLRGKPDAGNPHVRFDEGEVASEKPRRGSLLYNKMIKMAVIAVGAAAMFAGCGNGPDKVATKFMENFAEGKIEEAGKYATKQTGAFLTMAKSMGSDAKELNEMKGAKFEVVETKIDGDTASVKMKVTTADGKVEEMKGKDAITLIKEDGDWKVNIKKD